MADRHWNKTLRHKVCKLCDQQLSLARKGECGKLGFIPVACAWVPLLAAYAPATALRVAAGETEDWLGVLKGNKP